MHLDPQTVGGIVTIISAVTAAVVAIFNAWAGTRERKALSAKADLTVDAALNAASTATTAAENAKALHAQTREISEKTDGRLKEIWEENQRLHRLLTDMSSIMSAREGKPAAEAVRHSEEPAQPIDHERRGQPKDPNGA